jgi:kynureninase
MTQIPAQAPRTRQDCESLDRADPLRGMRARFALPEGVIYLDGHSLGPATHAALERVARAAGDEWRAGLIRSWNDAGWFDLPARTGDKLALLVGAAPGDVVVTDSVSVNLFKLAVAGLRLTGSRTVMVQSDEFPTDQSIAAGIADAGLGDVVRLPPEDALAAFGAYRGVIIRSAVNYRTGEVANIEAWERVAEAAGNLIVWDLSHATGVLDLRLAERGAKLAVGCTYKFLNGGPGAPAFVYARGDIAQQLRSPILGWFGQKDQFDFGAAYVAKDGAARFATGTPPVLSLSALDAALDAFDGVDLAEAAAKARALGDLVIARTKALGLETISPMDTARRGGHVSVRHEHGYAVVQALIARGIIPDFRAPDAMRFGVAPLYVRFVDVWDAMDALADVLATRAWDRPEFHRRAAVT